MRHASNTCGMRASRPGQTVESNARLPGYPPHARAPRQQHMRDEGQPTLADCGIGIACTRAPRQQHMQDEGLGMNSARFGVSGCELETSFTRGSLWNCVAFFEMFCIVLDLVRKRGVKTSTSSGTSCRARCDNVHIVWGAWRRAGEKQLASGSRPFRLFVSISGAHCHISPQ